jgi:hypothetical protein
MIAARPKHLDGVLDGFIDVELTRPARAGVLHIL